MLIKKKKETYVYIDFGWLLHVWASKRFSENTRLRHTPTLQQCAEGQTEVLGAVPGHQGTLELTLARI